MAPARKIVHGREITQSQLYGIFPILRTQQFCGNALTVYFLLTFSASLMAKVIGSLLFSIDVGGAVPAAL